MGEQHLCERHARELLEPGAPIARKLRFTGRRGRLDHAAQFEIALVVISEIHDEQLIYLVEVEGTRVVPIITGFFEATALDRKLRGYRSPRPLTHDAFADSIRLLGGEPQHILVHSLKQQHGSKQPWYYSEAVIRASGRLVELDLRPSDAFNLALALDCPIFFAEQVLAQIQQPPVAGRP